jgi:predicted patatin/cPLA2 family phospholipase
MRWLSGELTGGLGAGGAGRGRSPLGQPFLRMGRGGRGAVERHGAGSMRRPLPWFDDSSGLADPVLRLLIERARDGSRPGDRSGGARLALAIEGGGMAGAVSAGMCVALESLGLIAGVDVIYGSSAGALNASYVAAGQARSRATLYSRAAEARLIDPCRALRGRPPFRLSELVNSLLRAHPHDDNVLRGKPPLRVTATRVEDKGLDVLAEFTSIEEVRQAVWASCAIPILAGDIVEFRGQRYVDGGLIESLPYGVALREGATHVLVLRARHAGYRIRSYSAATHRAIDRLLRNAPDTIAELIRERPARYNVEASALQSTVNSHLAGRVSQLVPLAGMPCTSQFEARPRRLDDAIRLGVQSAYHALAPYLASAHASIHACAAQTSGELSVA